MNPPDVWCPSCERHHQPRERLVACSECGKDTDDVHARCASCRVRAGERLVAPIDLRAPVDRPVAQVGRDHPATAKAAASAALPRSGSDRRRVLDLLAAVGALGATDDELEVALGLPHQTASARRNGLVADGWVVDSGEKRNTRGGHPAVVWITREVADARPEGNQHDQLDL